MSYCMNCGTEIPEGSSFCTNCGAPVMVGTAPRKQEKPKKKMSRAKEAVIAAACVVAVIAIALGVQWASSNLFLTPEEQLVADAIEIGEDYLDGRTTADSAIARLEAIESDLEDMGEAPIASYISIYALDIEADHMLGGEMRDDIEDDIEYLRDWKS